MIDFIKNIDEHVFIQLNSINSPFFDYFMSFVTHKFSWIPLYCYFLYLIIKNKGRRFWVYLLIIGISITISDQSSTYIKHAVQRYRPCHNLEIGNLIHLVGNCGGKYGFVSSHASNSFTLATLLFFILKPYYSKTKLLLPLLFWALLVSYSRIYVGVHFPLDIICGGFLGVFIAYFIWFIYSLKKCYMS
ncbi:MAG: hypothetical protein A2X12_07945 [Bacteroidetes bacterium GWE2_29_8]|nr:MAG: hypothetical protein A2X12_07945 [Bacteroidetes bacterium GWE2_29_8]OFY16190.1 MAG: hypothetical protein A2X02_07185 [Bacteroidetes bacterium GWF2_29_10]